MKRLLSILLLLLLLTGCGLSPDSHVSLTPMKNGAMPPVMTIRSLWRIIWVCERP